MPLKSIQLATISPSNRAEGKFDVDAHSDTGHLSATFACSSESSALKLRDAIRDHADCLKNVFDSRDRPTREGPIALLVENVCNLNNGAMVQLGEFLRAHPIERAQFASRCAAMIESALEVDASRYTGDDGRPFLGHRSP